MYLTVQQYDVSGVDSGRPAVIPRDPVGRAPSSTHVAGPVAASQTRMDLIAQAGEYLSV